MDWRGGRSGSGKTSWRLLTAVGAGGDGAGMWEVAGQGQEAVGLGVEIAGGLGGTGPCVCLLHMHQDLVRLPFPYCTAHLSCSYHCLLQLLPTLPQQAS